MASVVARCNGTELVDRDGELWIMARRSPPRTTGFVLGLLAGILLINGTRGNPLGDSVHGCEQVLHSRGVTRA